MDMFKLGHFDNDNKSGTLLLKLEKLTNTQAEIC